MKKTRIGVIALIAVLLLIAFTSMVYADRNVPATPEIQGISTATSANVVGTVTVADSTAWTTTLDPITLGMVTLTNPNSGLGGLPPAALAQLTAAGGSITMNGLII